MTWSVLLRPWGFSFWPPARQHSQVGRWTRPAPSPGRRSSSGQTKPSDSFIPQENIYLFLPPAFLWNKWFSVADDWGTHARCMCSCVIHRQSHNGFPLLLSVHLVLSWQRYCLQTFLHCCFCPIVCSRFFLQMNVYSASYWGKKKLNKLFICFVTCFSVDGMFGENNCECTIKNYSLWICLNSSMLFRKCHLLFNAWLHGLMASTLILKVGSFLAKTLSLDNCHQIQR